MCVPLYSLLFYSLNYSTVLYSAQLSSAQLSSAQLSSAQFYCITFSFSFHSHQLNSIQFCFILFYSRIKKLSPISSSIPINLSALFTALFYTLQLSSTVWKCYIGLHTRSHMHTRALTASVSSTVPAPCALRSCLEKERKMEGRVMEREARQYKTKRRNN